MTLADPFGKLLTDIRDDAAVSAITTRIRGGEPSPGDADWVLDKTTGAKRYKNSFVVLSLLGRSRLKRAPVQEVRYVARCYGATFQGADALAGAVSDAIHAVGRRTNASGVVIFGSFDDVGQGSSRDPDTLQPVSMFIVQVNALTELLP